MASGENKSLPAQGKKAPKYKLDPNGIFAPTPSGIMWKQRSLYDQNGVEVMKNIYFPVRAKFSDYEVIGEISRKINDTKEEEAKIARRKNQEEENHKVCMQEYEERIQKLEEQLDKISLGIKKTDADNKSAGVVQPRRSKYLAEKKQKKFVEQLVDCHVVHTDISFDTVALKDSKEKGPTGIRDKLLAAKAASRMRFGSGVRGVPETSTHPQKRKIEEVYIHDSDEEDTMILDELPCDKKGTAARKNRENRVKMYNEDDPLDESGGCIVQRWMKTWDQFSHKEAPQ